MSTGTLSPSARQYFEDGDGNPAVNWLLYTYTAGSTTPATTYKDAGLLTQNTNPIVIDARGECVIFLAAGSYKYALHDDLDAPVWTQDNILATAGQATTGIGEIFAFEGTPDSPITDTTYPTGASFDKCHAGSNWLSLDTNNLAAGTYALQAMLMNQTGDTTTVGIFNLSDGSPNTALGACASSSLTGELVTSSALTLAVGGAAKTYAIKAKVSANTGFAWGIRLVRTS